MIQLDLLEKSGWWKKSTIFLVFFEELVTTEVSKLDKNKEKKIGSLDVTRRQYNKEKKLANSCI